MGKLSNYAENKVLDHILKVAAFTRPTHLYLGLCTGDPLDTGTGGTITEPDAGTSPDASYVRKACDSWASAASRATANDALITFEDCTADWDTITHFAILDTVTLATGNIIVYGAVTPNKTFLTGNTPNVAVGDLDVSVNAGGMSDYLANKMLDHLLEGTAFTAPTSIFVALCTATILDADTGTTISEPGQNYARIEHNDWKIAAAGASSNSGTVVYPKATGATWGTITNVGLVDDLTLGNLLIHTALNTDQVIEVGDIGKFNDGALICTAD